ncbi:MAG: hypothetical protein CL677_07970 [Bdellovibrionaceae bacterium]|nr:hypothetical protein [Pseudobdellovibrionaceae bacterium]|tara:strand:- start:70002 stop:70604 length:603 start_codon:yes stop_codon:yes gene_type:complete
MNLIKSHSEEQWIQHINDELAAKTKALKSPIIYLPAGNTPKALYKNWRETKPQFLQESRFLQIDEVNDGSKIFENFFSQELGSTIPVEPFSDGTTQADIALLGIGLNGHVGFHEPDIPISFYSGCVPLSAKSCHSLELEKGTWGCTYGVGAFVKCKSILLLAHGPSKINIVNEISKEDCLLPAAIIAHLPQTQLIQYLEK